MRWRAYTQYSTVSLLTDLAFQLNLSQLYVVEHTVQVFGLKLKL
jgi:hypothetical protein